MENQITLFQKMLKGDEQSLRILLKDYHRYLMVVGLRYLRDKQRVEDVIHDLFADLWNKGVEIEITSGVKSFLRGAVINKCLAIYRKESRMDLVENHSQEVIDTTPSPDHFIDRDNLKVTIEKVVNDLPEKCREVFKLSRYEGKSHQQISDAMGISKKTIENHMTRALKTLRNELTRKELMTIIFILINITLLLGEGL